MLVRMGGKERMDMRKTGNQDGLEEGGMIKAELVIDLGNS